MARVTKKKVAKKKAAARKSTAVATRQNTAMASPADIIKQQMANLEEKTEQHAGVKINTKGKIFTFPDGHTDLGPIEVVILDFVSRNNLFEGKYDANNIVPPVCFAVGENPKDMVPSPNGSDVQAASCQECPLNQWGSDGEGKACKNSRLMAVVQPGDTAAEDIMLLEASPTAIKSFDGYIGTVKRMFNMPPIGVITRVDMHPERDYPSLLFSDPQPNPDWEVQASLIEAARPQLFAEPQQNAEAAPKKKKAARGRR